MEKNKLGTLLSSRLDLPVKVKHQPWYRERLDSKYSRKCTNTSFWTFIKDGLDDYRDGKPPELDDSIVIKRNKGMKPNLMSSELFDEQQPCQRITKALDTYDTLYSKSIPNQRKRIERVKELENNILKGPSTFLPEINDLSPKVLQDVHDILNLSVNETNSSRLTLCANKPDKDLDSSSNSEVSKDDSTVESMDSNNHHTEMKKINLYKKHSSSLNSSEEHSCEEVHQINKKSIAGEMEQVEWVTKDFCDWVKNIGGEKNNIKEDTIKELFVCAYEGDPSASVVQTMNLAKVPSELLADAHLSRYTCIKRNIASRGSHAVKGDQIKYGAWYLHPKSWKARPANELLQDEKNLDENPKPRAKRDELDQLLPSLHSAQTFYNFTEEKKYSRKPELLRNVTNASDSINKFEKIETKHLPTIQSINQSSIIG